MKCKCGNEMGEPLVFPRPKVFVLKGEVVKLAYTAGMSVDGKCWFCAFDHEVPVLTPEQRAYVEAAWVD